VTVSSTNPLRKVGGVRLATWNVNSIRSRADRVAAWLQRRDIDVLTLQATYPLACLRRQGLPVPVLDDDQGAVA